MSGELGVLVVVVLKARNLRDKHTLYKQDVYAQVTIADKTHATKIDVKGGQHPVWDEELRFHIHEDPSERQRTMEVSCWSKEPRTVECLGKGTVDISETLQKGEFDDWVKLDLDGIYRGEVYLEMTFFTAGPPHLQRRASKLPPSERLARPTQAYLYPTQHSPQKMPPRTPPKSLSPSRNPPNLARPDSQHFPSIPTSPTRTHLAPPPSSSHSSPERRYEELPLPPLPQELTPDRIPAILRPGNPKVAIQASHRPRPEALPAQIRPSPSPPHGTVPLSVGSSRPQADMFTPLMVAPGYPLRTHIPASQPYITESTLFVPPPTAYCPPAQHLVEQVAHSRFPTSPPRPVHAGVPSLASPPPASGTYVPPPSLRSGNGRYPDMHASAPAIRSSSDPSESPFSMPMPGPFPDEPAGVQAPTHHVQPSVAPLRLHPGKAPASHHVRTPSQEDRDKMLAMEIEREEEEEREKQLAGQEESDFELARRLDMELNLPEDKQRPSITVEGPREEALVSTVSMPGSW